MTKFKNNYLEKHVLYLITIPRTSTNIHVNKYAAEVSPVFYCFSHVGALKNNATRNVSALSSSWMGIY